MTTKALRGKGVTAADTLSVEQFVRFRDLIEERCGLHFDESQRTSLSASLRARMQQLGLDADRRLLRGALPSNRTTRGSGS